MTHPGARFGARLCLWAAMCLCFSGMALAQATAPDPYSPDRYNSNGATSGTGRYDPGSDVYRPAPDNRTAAPTRRLERDDFSDNAPSAASSRLPEGRRTGDRYDRYDDGRYARDAERGEPGSPRSQYSDVPPKRRTYSENEVINAGHQFFGSVSQGLAKAIRSVFERSGPPNGYILGEDAGGAFVAGLRYGEGTLFTKYADDRKVYWQGPSIGYDFGGEGSKVMVLVYNLRRPGGIYRRFGGVHGSAYLVGGIGVQLLKHNDVTLATIRAGVGLRFGANVGYLKFTRRATWNPF